MPLRYSDVTPRAAWINRRRFLAAGSLAAGALARPFTARAGNKLTGISKSEFATTQKPTPYESVTGYNNYYEFGTGKDEPIKLAKHFRTTPWTVSLEGE